MAELADAYQLQEVVTVRPMSARVTRQSPTPRPVSRDSMLTPIHSPQRERKMTTLVSPLAVSPTTPPTIADAKQLVSETPALPASLAALTPDAIIDCPFKEFGCTRRGRTIDIKTHIRDDKFDHLAQMCQSTIDFRAKAMESITETTGSLALAAKLTLRSTAIVTKFSSQLTWRIDNYQKHFEAARKGRVPVIYSPPFHTHRHGYKMCAVLAPFGEGKAVRQYVSLFVSILRDEYDAILPWPFKCPVRISWMNQDGSEVHLTECILPKALPENDPFLGRPKAERNPAFGIQRFALVADIVKGKYVVNNTAFIRVNVDVSKVPTL